MRIYDLMHVEATTRGPATVPEMDPLREADALQEAQVLDVRFDVLTGTVGILFELRQALQLTEGNTGVLVARGVHGLNWATTTASADLLAWSVGSSVPSVADGKIHLNLGLWPQPGARLSVSAESASFFVGNVPGLPDIPPDYTQHDRSEVVRRIAQWSSGFQVLCVSAIHAAKTS